MLPGRDVGAQQLGFAPIIVRFKSLLAGLQQRVQLGDRAGKPGLQVLNFLVDLAVEPGGVQVQFPRELIGAVGTRPNGAFKAVQKFKRFLHSKKEMRVFAQNNNQSTKYSLRPGIFPLYSRLTASGA